MTLLEALVIERNGWSDTDSLSKKLFDESLKVLKKESERLYLEAQKNQLERELNEVKQKINQANTPL